MSEDEGLVDLLRQKEEEVQQLTKELKAAKGNNLWLRKDIEIKEKDLKAQLDEIKEELNDKQLQVERVNQALQFKEMEVVNMRKTMQSQEEQLQKMEDLKIEVEELKEQLKMYTEGSSVGGVVTGAGEGDLSVSLLSVSLGDETTDDFEEDEADKAEEVEEGMKIFDEKLKRILSPARIPERERRLSFMMAKYKGDGEPPGENHEPASESEPTRSPLKDILAGEHRLYRSEGGGGEDGEQQRGTNKDLKELVKGKKKKLVELSRELEQKMGVLKGWEDSLKGIQKKVAKEERKIVNRVGERENKIHELEVKTEDLRNQNAALSAQIDHLKNDADKTKARLLEAVGMLDAKEKAIAAISQQSEGRAEDVEVLKEQLAFYKRKAGQAADTTKPQKLEAELEKMRGESNLKDETIARHVEELNKTKEQAEFTQPELREKSQGSQERLEALAKDHSERDGERLVEVAEVMKRLQETQIELETVKNKLYEARHQSVGNPEPTDFARGTDEAQRLQQAQREWEKQREESKKEREELLYQLQTTKGELEMARKQLEEGERARVGEKADDENENAVEEGAEKLSAELDGTRGQLFLTEEKLVACTHEFQEQASLWQKEVEDMQILVTEKKKELERMREELSERATESERWRMQESMNDEFVSGLLKERDDQLEETQNELAREKELAEQLRKEVDEKAGENERQEKLLEELSGELERMRNQVQTEEADSTRTDERLKELEELCGSTRTQLEDMQRLSELQAKELEEVRTQLRAAEESGKIQITEMEGKDREKEMESERQQAEFEKVKEELRTARENLERAEKETEAKAEAWMSEAQGYQLKLDKAEQELRSAEERLQEAERQSSSRGGEVKEEIERLKGLIERHKEEEDKLKREGHERARKKKAKMKELRQGLESKLTHLQDETERKSRTTEELSNARLENHMKAWGEEKERGEERTEKVFGEMKKELESVKAELFHSMAIAIKLNLSMRGVFCNQNIMSLYEIVQQKGIPHKEWNKWLHDRLNS